MTNDINFWENNFEKGYYDKLITTGLQNGNNFQSNWHNCTYLNIKKYINAHDNHLDYACGSGTFIGRYLYRNSVGVDIAVSQINYARENFGKNNSFYSLNEFKKLNSSKFDIVTILGLIEFLNDDQVNQLLEDIKNLIKTKGRVVITTPNFSQSFLFIQRISRYFGVKNYDSVTVNKFNKKTLINILEKHFKEIKVTKIVNPGLAFSIFNNKLGLFIEKVFGYLFFNKIGFILLAEAKN